MNGSENHLRNKELFLRFQAEVFNGHDLSTATLRKYLHADFVDHSSWPGTGRGIEGFQSKISTWQTAFSEAHATNIALASEGAMLAVLYEIRAEHTGNYMGIAPTNEPAYVPAIDFYRFEDDRILERWSIYDYLTTALQIRADIVFEPKEGYEFPTVEDRPRRVPLNVGTELGREDTEKVRQNKAALFRFQTEVFNANDWSTETLERHLSPEIIDHNAYPGDPPGLAGVQQRFSMWQAAFDDADEENMALGGEGELLAVLYDLHAVHTGAFMGIAATRQKVVIPGIEFLRFEGGMIAEHWGIYDFKSTAEQIGATLTFQPREQEQHGFPNQSVSDRQKRRPFEVLRN